MGQVKGFLTHKRQDVGKRPVQKRVRDYRELELALSPDDIRDQASRCADCGIPFCHGAGCPLGNPIPEMNELVYQGRWRQACQILHASNNFPEITGRVCPAPCEAACTLAVNDDPVLIRHIEHQIVERGFAEGWITPLKPRRRSGKKVAVIGSGPAGLAAAQQLVRSGHDVVVFEQDARVGGMLRYGIPDFKLDKGVIDRRVEQLVAEGVDFQTSVTVGEDISVRYLRKMFDGACLAIGAREPRDLQVEGRDAGNILFAMDYLTAQNRFNSGESLGPDIPHAKGKVVVVIGGGDTGSDCVGTARRQGAREVYQLEILPKPPAHRPPDTPWPNWPRIMRTSSSHEEGCQRRWSVMTKAVTAWAGKVRELHACEVEWMRQGDHWKLKEIPGTDFTLRADLVLLAMGFTHAVHRGLVENLNLKLDGSGHIVMHQYRTSEPWVFVAGDATTGASLVVRAIDSGRSAAAAMDQWLR